MGVVAHAVTIVSARRVGRFDPKAEHARRIHITVGTAQQAAGIVQERYKLKGASLVVLDELSSQELAAQKLLWPSFREARTAGKKAHFCRARLFVDGKEVKPSVAAN